MKDRLYFRLGLLVSGAILLLVGMLFFFGMKEQFAPRIRMVTTFKESVQGLTVGAPVKLLGVPVGSVEELKILTDERLIQVNMSINPDVFQRQGDVSSQQHIENVRKLLVAAVQSGLQCRLEMAGVTGMRYVEMSYLPKEKQRPEPLTKPKDADGIYIASAPGTFTNIIDSAGEALTKIAQVDFPGIAKNLDENLGELQVILGDPALKSSIEKINNVAANLETISRNLSENVTGEEIQKLLENTNRTMEDINQLSIQVQTKLESIDTGRISSETADTLQAIRSMTGELSRTRIGVERTLQQVNSFLASTSELVDLLKRDPNAILRGKSVDPVKP